MKKLILFLIAGIFLFACVGPNVATDPVDMTPEQKVVFAWGIYKAQYRDYQKLTADPETLTEDQKKILRKKKESLTVAYNSILAYRMVVNAGETPTPEQEEAIMDFINQFAY